MGIAIEKGDVHLFLSDNTIELILPSEGRFYALDVSLNFRRNLTDLCTFDF